MKSQCQGDSIIRGGLIRRQLWVVLRGLLLSYQWSQFIFIITDKELLKFARCLVYLYMAEIGDFPEGLQVEVLIHLQLLIYLFLERVQRLLRLDHLGERFMIWAKFLLNLFYLWLRELVNFYQLVDLCVELIEQAVHLMFTLLHKLHLLADKVCFVRDLLAYIRNHSCVSADFRLQALHLREEVAFEVSDKRLGDTLLDRQFKFRDKLLTFPYLQILGKRARDLDLDLGVPRLWTLENTCLVWVSNRWDDELLIVASFLVFVALRCRLVKFQAVRLAMLELGESDLLPVTRIVQYWPSVILLRVNEEALGRRRK